MTTHEPWSRLSAFLQAAPSHCHKVFLIADGTLGFRRLQLLHKKKAAPLLLWSIWCRDLGSEVDWPVDEKEDIPAELQEGAPVGEEAC